MWHSFAWPSMFECRYSSHFHTNAGNFSDVSQRKIAELEGSRGKGGGVEGVGLGQV